MKTAFRQSLKAKAHTLNPVVLIGSKGLTENVMAETEQALLAHELIKVKINGMEREERKQCFAKLAETLQAEIIQIIGNLVVLYRAKTES
ncbi:MAG: ribosome assembly RNA-binding protein YhbY [Legionellaceae bacterium]|nr:ribosome assembly RNA-binding protein YhbY [Legionellaceae bacterium]